MKKELLIVSLALFLVSGCTKYAQIAYTAATNEKLQDKDNYFVAENDTLQVVYSFWQEKGVMSFLVYNKLDIPLYLDWKKSSFIINGNKTDYWSDGTKTRVYVSGTNSSYGYGASIWTSIFTQVEITKSKAERITFIPPKSYINISASKLVDATHFNMENAEKRQMSVPEGSSNTFQVYFVSADRNNSKIVFRNFLTYSTKETFDSEYYLDHEFYVRKVVTVEERSFQRYNSQSEQYEVLDIWKSPQRFYFKGINKEDIF